MNVINVRGIREVAAACYGAEVVDAWAGRRSAQLLLGAIAAEIAVLAELDDGVAAGFGILDLDDAEVRAVYVSPDHLRRGVGARILMSLEAIARERGLTRLGLDASLNAEGFYRRFGFESLGPATHEMGATGIHIDCIKMAKEIAPPPRRPATEFIGRLLTVSIDRPLGTRHPEHGFLYPVNYGFLPGVNAPDGEELDVYLLGIREPARAFSGRCIAVIHRLDDDDDKLVVAPHGVEIGDDDIRAEIEFQEKYFTPMVLRTGRE
jgi:inorganic pyrophosphatase